MARDTGPQCKQCRREGQKLFLKGERCLTDKCGVERRSYPPGEHGRGRLRASEYRQQLREKQKVRRFYGIMEAQFRKHFKEAVRRGGVTGDNLLQILESRLDNVVYRMGFADSRAQARQLVRHGHFMVNGRKTNVPSYLVKAADVVSVRPESRKREYFDGYADVLQTWRAPEWSSVDANQLAGMVLALPGRDQIEVPPFNDALIVEHYSR